VRRGIRPEIQALRAVAVVTVLVFHFWPEALPGGFVGVDVFFAISGFLITSHLVREVERTGSVSVLAFWARRVRRLLPASLVVLLATATAIVALVPLSAWDDWLAELLASALYVENWHLASSATDYFAQQDAPSPFQHFWSLSVEEQFYAVWPLLVLGAALLGAGLARRRAALAGVLGLVFAASLAYSILFTGDGRDDAYFSTLTRAWEFAAGGLLALLPSAGVSAAPAPAPGAGRVRALLARAERAVEALARALVSWAGIAAVFVAAAIISRETAYPGWAALLPVLGALAVIYAGAPRGPA
jgi:peptidoglycan/LPS O-acetylase OafA/YrhL